ncbi:putative agc protein kinase [Phaeomoniella chlamydospora]|uniref:Putative agc protein kinase n=1 Tax=Phaeomoniella chlamydospora TaxID=158046 RepID=A0A0G2EGC7_PHACM|nr:putative agc protein kinase [Phaeomoniella chlamydospora]
MAPNLDNEEPVSPSSTAPRSASSVSSRVPMERSFSQDIQEGTRELKEAAEQTRNIILDLSLDGKIRWVSPSWTDVVGNTLEAVKGKAIADFIADSPDVFTEAIKALQTDDSKSQFVKFCVKVGPSSELHDMLKDDSKHQEVSKEHPEAPDLLHLEGQGIMVFDRASGGESHTMWMLQPPADVQPVTIALPRLLVDSLGVGAEVLASHLMMLADAGATDPAHHPPPMPILCRVCERQITPWWFEKHSDLCVQEHRAEMDVQMAQETLTEHRHAIVKVLDALEARKTRNTTAEGSPSPAPPVEYKVRRPQLRIVELILDLCDTALEINTPSIKETKSEEGEELRTQSPQSESRISQVLQWQSPSSNTLDQEQGLALLSADTERLSKAKVDAVLRHRRIIEYSERIRQEFTIAIEDCIAEVMRKAERAAAGEQLSSSDDSGSSEDERLDENEDEPTPMQGAVSASSSKGLAEPRVPEKKERVFICTDLDPTPHTDSNHQDVHLCLKLLRHHYDYQKLEWQAARLMRLL